ncbi:hypothetical protein [Caproicibacter fermentans]|uniref:Uncharacterized protein n=1 Tax=Caproicibacter fermentans TaxID=2576756 RepID=A0A7G8T6W2_9FIRM|nr:hypothetical protein [Caproicibacter fermentans]QNK39353.1 hypothetical protein HCR03_11360 [Caproicibacter fermentans]
MKIRSIGKVHCIIIIILAALILCMAGWAVRQADVTPMQWVERHFNRENSSSDSEIAEVMKGNKAVIFYHSFEDPTVIRCAVLQKDLLGYQLLGNIGDISESKEESIHPTGDMLGGALGRGKAGFLYWGILYDGSISGVTVATHAATVVSTDGLRLWYYIGTQSCDYTKDIVYTYHTPSEQSPTAVPRSKSLAA